MKSSLLKPISINPLSEPNTVTSSRNSSPSGREHADYLGSTCFLPDDVLLEILPYLKFSDALNLSLTSKHVYKVAPPRVTTLVCTSEEMIVCMHTYFVEAQTPERLLRLRSLSILVPDIDDIDNFGDFISHHGIC